MPQPVFALQSGRAVARFGNLPQPNGQGTLGYVDLNDLVTWHLQDDFMADVVQQLVLGQQMWRGTSSNLGSDFAPLPASLPMEYREAPTSMGAALAPLLLAGEQWLTFDLVTGILARCLGTAGRKTVIRFGTRRWALSLAFMCRDPFFRDIAATTIAPVTLNSGAVTNFNVTYAGSVWTSPVWTLAIPNSTVAIAALTISNTMSGEVLTISFPGSLPAATAATITIDTGAMAVTDAGGRSYDVSGTAFPLLYGPAGTVQQIQATLIPASGTAVGCTIAGSYQNRWLI